MEKRLGVDEGLYKCPKRKLKKYKKDLAELMKGEEKGGRLANGIEIQYRYLRDKPDDRDTMLCISYFTTD